ncbi:MAG: hypothetical protein KAX28_03340, partial [Candidatus Marinimicrobia bacterium]|nr:hypothetical protein [Candidatus Neomarinimicrobiota bacterium]
MLQPDVIPTTEPGLRVGIILPEDEEESITIDIPQEPHYYMVSKAGNKFDLVSSDRIEFHLSESVISAFINAKAVAES